MGCFNWHELLFNSLIDNGNTPGARGKYVCLTKGETQNVARARKENALSASAIIIYSPQSVSNISWLKGTYIHIREDFFNDASGKRKHFGKRYHEDVYKLFDRIENILEFVYSKYPNGQKDPYDNWRCYVVKDTN